MKEKELKFAVDGMLGRVAKYLRALGYDTLYAPFLGEKIFTRAEMEGRVVVTVRSTAPPSFEGKVVIVSEMELERQLREIFEKLGARADRARVLSLCLKCNETTVPVSLDEVKEQVPEGARERTADYRLCPRCRRVFWWGSHADRMMEKMEKSGVFGEAGSE